MFTPIKGNETEFLEILNEGRSLTIEMATYHFMENDLYLHQDQIRKSKHGGYSHSKTATFTPEYALEFIENLKNREFKTEEYPGFSNHQFVYIYFVSIEKLGIVLCDKNVESYSISALKENFVFDTDLKVAESVYKNLEK